MYDGLHQELMSAAKRVVHALLVTWSIIGLPRSVASHLPSALPRVSSVPFAHQSRTTCKMQDDLLHAGQNLRHHKMRENACTRVTVHFFSKQSVNKAHNFRKSLPRPPIIYMYMWKAWV